jgi:peptide/nickel transport system ATP-binding protein
VTEAVLECEDLVVEFGQGPRAVRAVDGVSLRVARGEIYGLAGESGSGKSTLMYAITRLLPSAGRVVSGRVLYGPRDGEPVDFLDLEGKALRRLRWASMAIVTQAAMNALNPVLDVEAQLTDVLRAHRVGENRRARHDRAAELLSIVGITADRLTSFPHQLSGGMRQRVMIAMALALSPDVLILDEPTTALDVVTQRQILEKILEIRERLDLSIVFVTHDLALLFEIADRIAVMYAGELVEVGHAVEVRDAPLHPYSRALRASFPTLSTAPDELSRLPGSPPDLRALPSGCPFHPRCEFRDVVCHTLRPRLASPVRDESGEHLVACHLHDANIEMRRPWTPASSRDGEANR